MISSGKASLGAQLVKIPPANARDARDMDSISLSLILISGSTTASYCCSVAKSCLTLCNLSLGQEDPLEKGMTTSSSILAWKIPWTEGLMGLWRVRHDWVHKHQHIQKKNEILRLTPPPHSYFSSLYVRYHDCSNISSNFCLLKWQL